MLCTFHTPTVIPRCRRGKASFGLNRALSYSECTDDCDCDGEGAAHQPPTDNVLVPWTTHMLHAGGHCLPFGLYGDSSS